MSEVLQDTQVFAGELLTALSSTVVLFVVCVGWWMRVRDGGRGGVCVSVREREREREKMSLGGLVGGRRVPNTITYDDKNGRSTVLLLLFVCLFVCLLHMERLCVAWLV